MKYIITIEGQTIDLPEEIASDDEKLKKALSPFYPGATNALITRSEKDDVVTVNVVKRAGTKGALEYLVNCPESKNPVIVLYERLKENDPRGMSSEQILALDDEIQKVQDEGRNQKSVMEKTLWRLRSAMPRALGEVVTGF